MMQNVIEVQLASGQMPPETASALQRMRVELRRADSKQKVRPGFTWAPAVPPRPTMPLHALP